MKPIFDEYPHWRTSGEHERLFKQEVLKIFTNANIRAKKAVDLTKKIITILKGADE